MNLTHGTEVSYDSHLNYQARFCMELLKHSTPFLKMLVSYLLNYLVMSLFDLSVEHCGPWIG